MCGLPLLVAVLAAVPARAQIRAAAVDAVPSVSPAPAAGIALTPGLGSAPQAISLTVAPALAPSIGAAAAAAPVLGASPVAAPLAAPSPLPSAAALAPAARPAPAGEERSSIAPVEKALKASAEAGDAGMDAAERRSFADRLFGEDAGNGEALPAYLRHDQPLAYGARESADYRAARTPAERVAAALPLLESAGVRVQDLGGTLRILPVKDGTPLNRLAWNLERAHGAAVVYDPARLGNSGVAAFNHGENTLFLPHFDRDKSFPAVLHESHHSNYAARQSRGDLSPFHASVLARGGAVVPRVIYYAQYMAFEELTAHAKTIKHMLMAARRDGDSSLDRRAVIDSEVDVAADVARTAAFTASRLMTELDAGAAVVPVPADHWALPELGPIAGGSWWMVELPWSTMFLPVLDEPSPAPRSGLARLFGKKPASPGQRAARRTAEALLGYLKEASPLIESLHEGLESSAPDLERLNSLADSLSLAGPRAEASFKAATGTKKP